MTPQEVEREITELFTADQNDRKEGLYLTDSELFIKRDTERLSRARLLLQHTDIISPDALFNLAILFQHGQDPADYKIAWELAKHAAEVGHEDAKWLSAAAEDRYLLARGEKQKWGTQFRKNHDDVWELEPIASDEESGVTDEMRKEHDVPPRAEQLGQFLRIQSSS